MKSIFKHILLLVILVFGGTSCVEFLDRTPDAEAFTEEEIFTDFANYQNFVHQLLLRFTYFDDNDLTNQAGGAYSSGSGFHGKQLYGFRERITDNCYPAEGNHWVIQSAYRYAFTNQNDGTYFAEGEERRYETFWRAIRVCNVAIENIERLVDATEAQKAYILGLAYFCRAHFYFMLVQGWGGMPYITWPLDPSGEMDFERLSYTETCQKVAEDFETAAGYLPLTLPKIDWGYPTKMGAIAYKAKALIWAASPFANPENDRQLWMDAAIAAGEAIAMAENSGYYRLVDMSDWKKLFIDCEDVILQEILFGRFFEQWRIGNNPYIFRIPSTDNAFGAGGGTDVPQENLAMCFPWSNGEPVDPAGAEYRSEPYWGWGSSNGGHDGRDPRFYQTFLFNGAKNVLTTSRGRDVEIWNTSDLPASDAASQARDLPRAANGEGNSGAAVTGYYQYKYYSHVFAGSGTRSFNIMWNYVRLADVYLFYAEAANRVWGPTGAPQGTGVSYTAVDALNKVRMRAEIPPFSATADEPWLRPGTQQEFENIIRNEVRIETSFEEKRYYDLRRWRLKQDPDVKITLGIWIHQKAIGEFEYTQRPMPNLARHTDKWLERHYLFRIRVSDTQIGTKFKQNPGW